MITCVEICFSIVGLLMTVSIIRTECPGDSWYNERSKICKCFQCPEKPLCLLGTTLELLQKGEGTPGRCCSDYGCIPSKVEECSTTVCPTNNTTCPEDSVLTAELRLPGQCCPSPRRCKCTTKPGRCPPPPKCSSGYNLTMTRDGDGLPGSCCDTFACILSKTPPLRNNVSSTLDTSVDRVNCSYNEKEYKDGEKWVDGMCTECECKTGIAFCKHKQCPRLDCDQPVLKNGSCCPVCAECVTAAGVTHKESEVWKEEDCVHCSCESGLTHCQAEECQTNCINARKIDGQCCPVCDDENESFVALPAYCPPLNQCDRLCREGYVQDADGCFRCECKIENCTLICEFGYETDAISGDSICSCLKNTVDVVNITSVCPNITSCNNSCTLTQIDLDGCPTCECEKERCPEFKIDDCAVDCTHGYQYDLNQCLTCSCIDDPADFSTSSAIFIALTSSEEETATVTSAVPTPKITAATMPPVSCNVTPDVTTGFLSWNEGCHQCFCLQGKAMCDLPICPFTVDLNGGNSGNRCCGSPAGSRKELLSAHAFCLENGGKRLAKTDWSTSGHCTDCICREGAMYCEEQRCKPLFCSGKLVQKEGFCCPVCEETPSDDMDDKKKSESNLTDIPGRKRVGCRTPTATYLSGESWWESRCRSCLCHEGAVKCSDVQCPVSACDVQAMRKGDCCPICLNITLESTCLFGERVYTHGENWKPSECSSCLCSHGQAICDEMKCAPYCAAGIHGPCCEGCVTAGNQGISGTDKDVNVAPTEIPSETNWLFPFFFILTMLSLTGLFGAVIILVRKCRQKQPIAYTPPSVSRTESPSLSTSKLSSNRKPIHRSYSYIFPMKKNQIPI